MICHTRRPAICQGGCRRRLMRGRMTPHSSTICKECWKRRKARKEKKKQEREQRKAEEDDKA
ncbi:MAG: hypothetical protein ABGX44_07475 [Candidatus Poseidoniia archaeon]